MAAVLILLIGASGIAAWLRAVVIDNRRLEPLLEERDGFELSRVESDVHAAMREAERSILRDLGITPPCL